MTSLLTKEEQEELLNQKIEMMKKKNAELMKRHQLAEEDKRLAEQQGRSVTIKNQQAPYSPMKGEILRAAEEDGKRKTVQNSRNQSVKKYNGPNVNLPMEKSENSDSGPPPDPTCKFLADRRREGPLPSQGRGREFTRRHPRNFGGIDFNVVPKKIHDEKERQTHQPQIRTKADEMLYTTGKERRELQEWRREREKIDRERLERQKNKEGNWKREWDRDKDELSCTDELVDDNQPLNSRQPQSMMPPRLDDRFKANGQSRNQRKKDGQNESDAATPHQVNNSNRKTQQHLNDETSSYSREKPEKLQQAERSLLRATDQRSGDEGKRFRRVQEQNDSLVIKFEAQTSDSSRVPSYPPGNVAEPDSPNSAYRNHPKTGRRNFRDERSISGSSDGLWVSGRKTDADLRRVEEQTMRSAPERTSKNAVNSEKTSYSRNASREYKGETLDVESRCYLDESSQNSPRKAQSDSKTEKQVGSGRISVPGKKRRNNHRRKRDGAVNREQQLDHDLHTDSGLATVEQNTKKKTPADTECTSKTREIGSQDVVVADRAKTKPPVFRAYEQMQVFSSKNSDHKEEESKTNSKQTIKTCIEEKVMVKPDLLGKSFDLDLDPPEGEQFDDEEWEDIDEEVCIDLIAGGEEESYEEGPLDISDDTFEQLVNAHIILPRGQKVVDWATEMESADDSAAVAGKQAASDLVSKSLVNESL